MTPPPKPPDDVPTGWSTSPDDAAPTPTDASFLRDASRGIRLQKVLASAGIASRRASEQLVAEGAVRVNGHLISELPAWVDPKSDHITVHGKPVRTHAPTVCVMLFKPRGVVCTAADEEHRRRAIDLVQHPTRVRLFSVGRLDMDSSGLLLLTNDGVLSNLLTHPSHHVPRVYDITVDGEVDATLVRRLERGINLPDDRTGRPRPARFESVRILQTQRDRTRMRVVLTEGRNRQIRRMMLVLGHPVRKLRRIAFGPLKLADLRPGQWRDLTPREIEILRKAASKPRRRKRGRRTQAPEGKAESDRRRPG